jgi:BED zinc finger
VISIGPLEPTITAPIAPSFDRFNDRLNNEKTKAESAWVWSQYSVVTLESMWRPRKRNSDIPDRLITCIRCNKWTTKDSLRYSSTSNMIRHLGIEHKVYQSSLRLSNPSSNSSQSTPSIGALFLQQSNKDSMKLFEKNLIRWIIADDMAFSAIESPFFQQMIYDIPNISMPFQSRNTLASRISIDFVLDRQQLIQDLAITS